MSQVRQHLDRAFAGEGTEISGDGPRQAAEPLARRAAPERFTGCWMCGDKRYVGNATGREPCVVCNREELRRLYPLHDPGDESDHEKPRNGYAPDWHADRDAVDESDDYGGPGALRWIAGILAAVGVTVLLVLFAGGKFGA